MYREKVKELFDYTVDIRRRMHENPELSSQEDETVELVIKELEKIGIDYVEVKNGGVLAFVEGNPAGVKCMLAIREEIQEVLRLPLLPVSKDTKFKISEAIVAFSL